MSRSRNPPPRGQGAARAKQMGLLLDLSPDGGMNDEGNDEELEAELLNLVGGGGGGRSQGKKGEGKAPVPMAEIERMAALCMKDLDDEEIGDDDLDDDDLLAELNDVLEEDEEETPAASPPAVTPTAPKVSVASHSAPPAAPSGATGLESRLLERIDMYKTAISNAKAAGETSKVRRYDRGLKTLQSMLTSARKGKPVNEEEMPPPVALGGKPNATAESESTKEREPPQPTLMPSPPTNQKPLREAAPTAPNTKPVHLTPPQKPSAAITPETPAISPLTPSQPDAQHSELKQAVLSRHREYKMAAIHAKQNGDIDLAKQHYLTSKKIDLLVEALDAGKPVDLSSLPPPPGDVVAVHCAPPPPQSSSKPAAPSAPAPTQVATADLPAPRSLAEALQQRMDIYKSAAEGAKSKGDDRKARMHQRIVKQYQDAIKAHKAGRPVSLSDLPVPPGCPPLQGSEGGQQNFLGVLETAMKIANQDADGEDEEEDGQSVAAKPAARPPAQKAKSPAPQAPGGSTAVKLGPKAQQQVDFLLLRRQAFMRAALRSKQMKDMSGAAQHLRHAKGLDPMITAAKSGLPVDISKIPSAPVSEEDYSLARSRTSPRSSRSSEQYHGLMDLLRKQHERCLANCQQFVHLGSVAEALKFEKLVEECMKNIEILKNAHAKGQPVPKCHTEERTFNTVKIYSNLTLNEMVLYIIRGINLPAPSGVSPNDLDASVKFEFPFPSAEEAQRDKTSTVKNTSSPEFKEQFKLNINRTHRGFKRVVQSKGIKFEVIHKGGLFKTDKVVGTAQLKLEALENHCDMREIIEVMDGRKATGGKLEVRVKIREPLSGVDLQPVTEKWLVLEPVSSLSPPERQKERAPSPRSKPRHEASSSSSSSSGSSSSGEESGSESEEESSEESEKTSSDSGKSSSGSEKSSSESESEQKKKKKKKTKKAPLKKNKPTAADSDSDENGNGPVAQASSSSPESSSGSETDSEDDSDSDSHTAQKKKSEPKSKPKVEVKSKKEVSLLDLDDFSPAPTNAPKSLVVSPSLLSDLEGLSLSNISSTMQVTTPSFGPVKTYELLHHMTGKGLSAKYHFPRQPCLYQPSMVAVQVILTNSSDHSLEEIHIGDRSPASLNIHCFNTIERLEPEASVTVSMGIDFSDSTQAANFQLCTKEDHFSVSIQPAVGELLMPSSMTEQDFCKEQGKLLGMNETSATITMATANTSSQAISKQVLSVANVGVVSSSQNDFHRFAGRTVSSSAVVLVSLEQKESSTALLTINTEKSVMASMLLRDLKQALAQA